MPSAKLPATINSHGVRASQTTAPDNEPRRQPSIPRTIVTCKSNSDLTKLRMFQPVDSTYLRSGMTFEGIQQSGRSTYHVQVKFYHVDLHKSFLCGLLQITGLSSDNPSLTTYFEAEIIGRHYSFLTKRPDWGATESIDLQHWTRFPALKQGRLAGKSMKNGGWDKAYKNPLEMEYVFMRWKEKWVHSLESESDDSGMFDETLRSGDAQSHEDHEENYELQGVSFAGFYYISFQQSTGNISGMYYAENSEQFQQLDLSPVKSHRPGFPTFEFR